MRVYTSVGMVLLTCATLLGWTSGRDQGKAPTLREMLREKPTADPGQFPQDLLDRPIHEEKRGKRYVQLSFHESPSAQRLLVLSRDLKLRRELYGWELATLPDERIVYHHSQVHVAPTHQLEISIFDPATLTANQIYPPTPHQPVRREFIARVDRAYRERGEDWFRVNNHHMDAERFNSALTGAVRVDAAGRWLTFTVRFGNAEPSNDPVAFAQLVHVSCSLTGRMAQIQCRERAASQPR